MKNFRPVHTLLFLICIFSVLALISYFYPEKGINLNKELTFNFPQLEKLTEIKDVNKDKQKDISNILKLAEEQEKIDSINAAKKKKPLIVTKDSVVAETLNVVKIDPAVHDLITTIQFRDGKKGALDKFFKSLRLIDQEKKSVRILHYGDSQIEGDRISDYLRMKLQNQFGGEGPGFISAAPVAQSVAIRQKWSDNFDRYNVFIGKDKRVKHGNFGVMASFCRFLPYRTVTDSSRIADAFVKISNNKNGGARLASYNKVKMFYGGGNAKTKVEFYENGNLTDTDSLNIGGYFNIKTWNLNASGAPWEVKFSGQDSPDIYGFSLEGEKGVMVDNFGLRGSSGTFFNQMSQTHLQQFFEYLNTKLIILQFGGNALPYMKDSTMAINFGKYLKGQINTLKRIAPDASILVIGPADMSVKVGTDYVTHPQLENLRDAIRRTAFDTDCAFWDMYEVMGGKNSMVEWVKLDIAATDYIHFAPAGARKIATLLYGALYKEYENYIQNSVVK